MNYKHLLSVLLAGVLTCMPVHAYVTDTNLTGHVVEAGSGEHIPGFIIRIPLLKIGTTTDASGHYNLRDLRPGKITVEASYPGYVSIKKDVTLIAGKTVELNFEAEPDVMMLDQVVVTGSKTELKRRHSPALISVVDNKVFDNLKAASLADGLSYQPGVRVENNCQNCGFTQVRINGLDGHYSQILLNSRPVFSALAGVYGLEQIPANIVDRVEVMRGGGSALFGASAIGGTVNIITKDPDNNYAEASHTITSIGMSSAMDNNTTVNASVTGHNNNIGLVIYGQNRTRDGYDHDGDGYTEIPQLRSTTLGLRSNMNVADGMKLSAEYHGTHEYRRGGDQLDVPPHQAMVAEQTDHNINGGELSFDYRNPSRNDHLNVYTSMMSTRRTSYYGSEQDPNAYGRTSDLTVASGAQWTHNFTQLWFMPSELIGGIEYNYNYLHDVTVGYSHDALQKVNTYSAYAQNEWRDDKWGFLIGARIDKNSLISNPIVSPRVNIRFNPSPSANFRLSYSTGFRSPQAYDEDFHIAVVGGDRVVTILAPGLKQESSNSISGSADFYHRFGNVQCNLIVEGFYTDLRDVFALRMLDHTDEAGNAILERYNGDGARVGGLNCEMRAAASRWSATAGITWQRSRYKKPEQWSDNPDVAPVKKLFRTPDLYGFITADCRIWRSLRANFNATYTGSMPVQHLAGSGTPVDLVVDTPAFLDASLRISYEFRLFRTACLDISAGITNIFNSYQKDFDKGYLRDSGYIYGPMTPRSMAASVKLHL